MNTFKAPWEYPVKFLKGVGDKLSQLFAKAGIETAWDLFLSVPRTYEDRRRLNTFQEICDAVAQDLRVQARAKVLSIARRGAARRQWTEMLVAVDGKSTDRLTFVFFSDPGRTIEKRYPLDSMVLFRGKIAEFRGRLQITHPELELLDQDVPDWERGIVPVYREVQGLSTRVLRRIVAMGLSRAEFQKIPEALPAEIRARFGFGDLGLALRELHFPKSWEPFPDAKPRGPFFERVVFEELFLMALALHLRRAEWREQSFKIRHLIPKLDVSNGLFDEWISELPFALTDDQRNAMTDIRSDLALGRGDGPMHRLIQGDVGSGKTIVAFLSALTAMQSGFQVAMMAPTELLADQHYQSFVKLFPEFQDSVALLKGALTAKKKKDVRTAVESGTLRFVIGTQALLSDGTLFSRLGLVIIDEQHRFGVEQRLDLRRREDAYFPHLLVMTATPIPRSLALTLYGDLSLTQIRQKPAGRKPIATHLIRQKSKAALEKRIKQFLDDGRQAYLVYPLVEENEDLDLLDVKTAFGEWGNVLAPHPVALLHGKMKSSEKERVMKEFKEGAIRALVSTTVIEVGVDVPNASVIVIEHAERFGLSQLHQLRGRVGRGVAESLCVLVAPDRMSPLVEERLNVLVSSEDGFYIAEKDLDIRGPGEFLGRRQSGLPGFRVAHVLRDVHLMERARDEARAVLEADPELKKPEHRALRNMIQHWWRGRMELTLSG